jgi:DNA ligase D-like protein (predicted ligase)
MPSWADPMLATLTHERFSDAAWIFERKLDGERCLAFRDGRSVHLFSRNRKPLDATYPEVVDALQAEPVQSFIIDGEIVAFVGEQTSFERLQQRMQIADAAAARRAGVPVVYYVFDLLYLDGRDTRRLPLSERKRLLRDNLKVHDPVRFTGHRDAEGEAFYAEACRKGWEGLIAKRAESIYTAGRSRDWLKFKCSNQQEFVIGGYTDPQGERFGFGALLVGYWEQGKLTYAGKVGTGYNEDILRRLSKRLAALETSAPVFTAGEGLPRRGVHLVKPALVCEVAFTEWTTDGKLRHPRFLGLRDDKDARSVVREG